MFPSTTFSGGEIEKRMGRSSGGFWWKYRNRRQGDSEDGGDGYPKRRSMRLPRRRLLLSELNDRLAAPNAVGKISIEVDTAELRDIRTAFQCRVAAVVFLNRHTGGSARLVPLSAEDAFCRLNQDLPLFEEPVHEQHRASLRNLLEAGAFELRYGDLDEAVNTPEPLVR